MRPLMSASGDDNNAAASPAAATCSRSIALSGIIGVPGHVLVSLLRDLHTIELYGFPHVATRCLLETFALPTDIGAIRRCTLAFGAYQGCMLREQLVFSGEKRGADGHHSAERDYVIQLRFLDGSEDEADRSPFGTQGRRALLEAVTTYTVTPITTSLHQCFFRLNTSLLLRDDATGETNYSGAHEAICRFWTAYGHALSTAIQRYIVSKAYSPEELGHVDDVERDAEAHTASLEHMYLDLAAGGETTLPRQTVLELLESVLVHARRLRTAYRTVRLQGLAERASSPPETSSPEAAARLQARRQVGDRMQADAEALRVQTAVEMTRQWDALERQVHSAQEETPAADAALPSSEASHHPGPPRPPRMIDTRAPTDEVSPRTFASVPAPSSQAQAEPLAADRTDYPATGAVRSLLSRVASASREADMMPAAPPPVTARGDKPSMIQATPPHQVSSPAGVWTLAKQGATTLSTHSTLSGAVVPCAECDDEGNDAAGPMRLGCPDAAADVRDVPLTQLLASSGYVVNDQIAQEILRRFWRGRCSHEANVTDARPMLPPLRHTPSTAQCATDKSATAVMPTSQQHRAGDNRYWTVDDMKDLLRALNAAGARCTAVDDVDQGLPSHPPSTRSPQQMSKRVSATGGNGDLPRLSHPSLSPTSTSSRRATDATPSSFSAYKREAQRVFLERYSSAAVDRMNSSLGDSSLANSGFDFSPPTTFHSTDAHAMSGTFTNTGEAQFLTSVAVHQSGAGYFSHKAAAQNSPGPAGKKPQGTGASAAALSSPTTAATTALARVEALLGPMETPEQVLARKQAGLHTQRQLGQAFVPPLLRRDLPSALDEVCAHMTLQEFTARQVAADAAAGQRQEDALQRAAEALVNRFAHRETGRLCFDEAVVAVLHATKD